MRFLANFICFFTGDGHKCRTFPGMFSTLLCLDLSSKYLFLFGWMNWMMAFFIQTKELSSDSPDRNHAGELGEVGKFLQLGGLVSSVVCGEGGGSCCLCTFRTFSGWEWCWGPIFPQCLYTSLRCVRFFTSHLKMHLF